MRKEIFGPVMPIMKGAATRREAVRLANDSQLGLMAYVFTDDKQKGRRLAREARGGHHHGQRLPLDLRRARDPVGRRQAVGHRHQPTAKTGCASSARRAT